ncbi:uncharacterized protein LOC113470554 [Diaphorina citri]|uniref:Nucleolar protein 12 n=1 Tax=Diaphorina citri TaxID=121845 RepID=A0A3Q0J8U1_DIACI|nr:uncharacterized protein LOC113470554 [Diaphorina citri]
MGFLFQVLIRFCVLLEVKHLTADKIDLGHGGERDVLYLMLNRHSGQNKITPFESNGVNLNTFTARPNLNTFSAPKEYRVRQYRWNLVRSIQRYLSYLEREWEVIDRNELPHVLLGLTVAQAQLQMSQITPNPNPLLQYLTLKTNQVRTLFLKLILEDSNNRQLWTRVFHPKLWRISETLRMLRENDREFPNFDGNDRTFAKVRGNERDFAKFRGNGRAFTKFSERDRSFTKFRGNQAARKVERVSTGPESPSCDNVERGAYFRETRLREKSNECLQGLLTECSSSEECRDLMMEPAGGYSLAHQTLYFILARDYLTGFQKRNQERRQRNQERLEQKLKEEKKRIKKEAKESYKKLVKSYEPIPEVEDLLAEEHDLPSHSVSILELNTEDIARENCWIGKNQVQYAERQ